MNQLTTGVASVSAHNPRLTRDRALNIAAGIALVATLLDALVSWILIDVARVAIEGNDVWAIVGQSYGFGVAMVIRALWGVLLILCLWAMARGQWGTRKSDSVVATVRNAGMDNNVNIAISNVRNRWRQFCARGRVRAQRLARVGMFIIAVVMSALALYQIAGTLALGAWLL